MQLNYQFELLVVCMIISTCCISAAPSTNQSASSFDDYDDDYNDDYYDEHEVKEAAKTEEQQDNTQTTSKPLLSLFTSLLDIPKQKQPERSNHVIIPSCPKACLCLQDFKYIQCSHSGLTEVPQDLPATALILDLSYNQISQLRTEDFANSSRLRDINLSYNEIETIDKEAFTGLLRLQRLNLANNKITQVQSDTFSLANDLSHLDLSNNTIVLGAEGTFLHQPSLLEFTCRNCSWGQLYDDTFANITGLTTLKLDQNDFNKKINTQAFRPLKNLIKLKLPELDETSVQELCNLLKSIDNISFRHFDISCYELVLGTSFNESLILATDPPFKAPATSATATAAAAQPTIGTTNKTEEKQHPKKHRNNNRKMTDEAAFANLTLTDTTVADKTVLAAGFVPTASSNEATDETSYKVPISQEAINYMLISIMILAVIGLIIGIICRRDVGGIKTKCCRTRKPEPKDQVHPAEEIPLNKLA